MRPLLKEAVNPVIEIVKKKLEQSGYSLPTIDSLYDKNIDIININYGFSLQIERNINLLNIIGCVSSLFNIEQGNIQSKNGIIMRYKRVANFSEMDSLEAFILDLLKNDHPKDDIIEGIQQNFGLSKSDAQTKLVEVINY